MDSGLTDEAIAREYLARGGGYLSADHLVAWMNRRGIGHRNAAEVALAVNRLQVEAAPTTEEVTFQENLVQGTTRADLALRQMDQLALAQRVAAMSLAEFGAERGRLGVHQSMADFLAGM